MELITTQQHKVLDMRSIVIVLLLCIITIQSCFGSNPLATPLPYSFSRLDSTPVYSSSHCFSSNKQDSSSLEWRSNACALKNLCFNTSTKELVFFAKDESEIPEWVSIATFNLKWARQYDDSVRYRPKIVHGPIPSGSWVSPSDELWIPYLPFCPANVGHVIWDDFLSIFSLAKTVLPFLGMKDWYLRLLWYNVPNDPPWATCDWIRQHEGAGHGLEAGYSDRCLRNLKRWLPVMLGNGKQTVLPESMNSFIFQDGKRVLEDNSVYCFSNAAYGLTAFSNQGSGHHGWNPKDKSPPSFGRSLVLFDFTRHLMKNIDVFDVPNRSQTEIIIFFSSFSSNRVYLDFSPHIKVFESLVKDLEQDVAHLTEFKELKISIRSNRLDEMSPKDQMELAKKTCLFISAAGGGAFTAQFLPPGASVLLYETAGSENVHRGKVDWKFFAAASWMRTHYLNAQLMDDRELLMKIIREEVFNCIQFLEILKV